MQLSQVFTKIAVLKFFIIFNSTVITENLKSFSKIANKNFCFSTKLTLYNKLLNVKFKIEIGFLTFLESSQFSIMSHSNKNRWIDKVLWFTVIFHWTLFLGTLDRIIYDQSLWLQQISSQFFNKIVFRLRVTI